MEKKFYKRILLILLMLAALVGQESLGAELPAFIGAVGQGATATGGRGGDVYHVTNLLDYDSGQAAIPGSLRYGIDSANRPRTIVFDVGGGIELARPLSIRKDKLTLAGQTSPSGVTLWGYPTSINGAEDVVVRFLRFRPGDFNAQTANPDGSPTDPVGGKGNMDLLGNSSDSINIYGNSNRVILDHVSASWSMDETLSVTVSQNVTVQHSIIEHSLNDSFHHKGPHGYGSLVRGELTEAQQASGEGGYTFYGNLWAHHTNRNPSFGGQQNLEPGQSEADRRALDVNFVNNVIYNKRGNFTHRNSDGGVRANLVGNYYVNGPESASGPVFNENANGVTHVYQENNFVDPLTNTLHDGFEILSTAQINTYFRGFESNDSLTNPGQGTAFNFYSNVASQVKPAEEAYDRVVAAAGASLWRDAIDASTIADLTSRTGAIIDSQDELRVAGVLHGIDDLPSTARPAGFDTDADGIPNDFETARGLDPDNPADGKSFELSPWGYTNLEFYLDWLVRDLFDALPPNADFDASSQVNGQDFLVWQRGSTAGRQFVEGDSNGDGMVDAQDLSTWQSQFGSASPVAAAVSVPEAGSLILLCGACLICSLRRNFLTA